MRLIILSMACTPGSQPAVLRVLSAQTFFLNALSTGLSSLESGFMQPWCKHTNYDLCALMPNVPGLTCTSIETGNQDHIQVMLASG